MNSTSKKTLLVKVFVLITSLMLTQALLTFEPVLAGGGEAYAVEEIITHIPGLNINLVDVRTESGLAVWFRDTDGAITLTVPIKDFTTAYGWSIVAGYPKVVKYSVLPYQAAYALQWYFKHGICVGSYCIVDREVYYTSGIHVGIYRVEGGGVGWACIATGIGRFEKVVTTGDCA